jgi:GGDEF domain-containing protein
LGLVVCKELVELHNGRIDVTSEVGRGTTFTVLLPRYTEVLALSTGFNELGILAKQQGKPLGLLALRADASLKPSGEADERRQQLERLAEEIRRSVHRDDVVLEMEPHWVVLLVIADTDGVRAIVRRLRGSLGMSDAVQVGAALYPDDGTDPMALFERATKTLNQGLASVS